MTTRIPGSDTACWPVERSRSTTSRNWVAVAGGRHRPGITAPHPARRSRRWPRFQACDEAVGPARDHVSLAVAGMGVAERPLFGCRLHPGSASSTRPRPARSVPGRRAGDRGHGYRTEPGFEGVEVDLPAIDRIIEGPVAAVVLGFQGELGQVGDLSRGAQQGVGEERRACPPASSGTLVLVPEAVEPLKL